LTLQKKFCCHLFLVFLTKTMANVNVQVPVIDLKPFYQGGDEGKKKVAEQIGKACVEIGFFVITNHGVEKEVIDRVWDSCRRFFDLSVAEKREVPMTENYPYGYSGFGDEVLSMSKNVTAGADLKESFQICLGPENMPKEALQHQPLWPSKPNDFLTSYTAYYRALERLSTDLLRLFALALRLPENWFEDKITRHQSALRVLNYPHQDTAPIEGQLRASAHTDYGSLTILRQDNAPGGLQVLNKDKSWQDIKTPDDAFVINLGDLMARWTNDAWVSTVHRVINPPTNSVSSTRRQSMAFFHNLTSEAVVECIETCKSNEKPAKYPPVLAGEYLMSKHGSANKKY